MKSPRLLPSYWLSETYRSGPWMPACSFYEKCTTYRSSCWCSWRRVEQLYGLKSIVGMTNEVFPWNTTSLPIAVCWVRGIFVTDQRELERGSKRCSWIHLDANLSALNLVIGGSCGKRVVEEEREYIPGLTDTTVSWWLRPKRASRIQIFFNLLRRWHSQYVGRSP